MLFIYGNFNNGKPTMLYYTRKYAWFVGSTSRFMKKWSKR